MLFNAINLWLCTFNANYLVCYLGRISIVEKTVFWVSLWFSAVMNHRFLKDGLTSKYLLEPAR